MYSVLLVCTLTFVIMFFLKSARFGKGFLGPEVSSDVVNDFVEMCHHLRVLNSVRMEAIGLPITMRQYP